MTFNWDGKAMVQGDAPKPKTSQEVLAEFIDTWKWALAIWTFDLCLWWWKIGSFWFTDWFCDNVWNLRLPMHLKSHISYLEDILL